MLSHELNVKVDVYHNTMVNQEKEVVDVYRHRNYFYNNSAVRCFECETGIWKNNRAMEDGEIAEVVNSMFARGLIPACYLSDHAWSDKRISVPVLSASPFSLMFCPDNVKDDKQIILLVVGKDGMCLKDASDRLKDDMDVVLAAVSNNASSIRYASERLKDDIYAFLTAVCDQTLSIDAKA